MDPIISTRLTDKLFKNLKIHSVTMNTNFALIKFSSLQSSGSTKEAHMQDLMWNFDN